MTTKIYATKIEQSALDQFNEAMKLDCNVQGALMSDAHTGYTLPIGAVVKSKGKIFPSYVGYDIGCGVCAIRTSVQAVNASKRDLQELKSKILKHIPLGVERHHKKIYTYDKYIGVSEIAQSVFKDLAGYQLGTLGGGNHFIEIGKDYDGYLNIIIHSGSRGVGHKIAKYYMRLACQLENRKNDGNLSNKIKYLKVFDGKHSSWLKSINEGKSSMVEYNTAKDKYVKRQEQKAQPKNFEGHFAFDIDTEIGQAYISDLNAALDFALDNRRQMIQEIILAMQEIFVNVKTSRFINRNHNHAEIKDGHVIHRKGATHAELDMLGVIPGNMEDGSFIVKGKGNPESMSSSSHGAGRVKSRGDARRAFEYKDLKNRMKDIVTNLKADMTDEDPRAYKNIFEVMRLQQDLVDVIDRVVPVLNIKG